MLLALAFALFALAYPRFHANDAAKINERVPAQAQAQAQAQATDFIIASGLSGRMFNTYHYGGYLIFRLAPQQQVFIDIRGDMFGGEVMKAYQTIHFAHRGWQAQLEHYAIDYIVYEASAPLVDAATAAGLFVPVYRDAESVVLVRDTERYRPLITAYHAATQ